MTVRSQLATASPKQITKSAFFGTSSKSPKLLETAEIKETKTYEPLIQSTALTQGNTIVSFQKPQAELRRLTPVLYPTTVPVMISSKVRIKKCSPINEVDVKPYSLKDSFFKF